MMALATAKPEATAAESGPEVRAAPERPPRRAVGPSRRLKSVSLWARQLYVLVRCGTPLAQALSAVERQSGSGRFRSVVADLRRHIDEGVSLSQAMARHREFFDPIACSLMAAGESSGRLDAMFDRLAALSRQQLRLRRSLIGALIYPALLIVVAASVLTSLICFVLPRFAELFTTLDAPLPPSTRVLMSLSAELRQHWWMGLVAVGGTVVTGRLLLRTSPGRRALDRWYVAMPLIGQVVRSIATARLLRLLGALLNSRVPLLESLQLTRESAGNTLYVGLVDSAVDAVTRGEALSMVFARSALVTPAVAEAIHHGEQSGQLGPMLSEMADFMDEENETVVRTLTGLLEPLILIVLGAVVALVAVSMFMPLFDVTAMTQQGG
jgi:type II secretory pathway component PulF